MGLAYLQRERVTRSQAQTKHEELPVEGVLHLRIDNHTDILHVLSSMSDVF